MERNGWQAHKVMGHDVEIFIDKLGERLAFERSGVRLYDAALAKIAILDNIDAFTIAILKKIRDEEHAHFKLIYSFMEKLGADPTAQTPCADVSGVSAMGLLQVITEPRTTLSQTLNALLTIEMVDNASWELLIKLAQQFGHANLVPAMEEAFMEEQQHLIHIKTFFEQAVLSGR